MAFGKCLSGCNLRSLGHFLWPVGTILLLQPPVVETFARSSRLFGANFNNAYRYPVIVFHEQDMNNETYRQRLRSVTKSRLYFQVRRDRPLLTYNNTFRQCVIFIRPSYAIGLFLPDFSVSPLLIFTLCQMVRHGMANVDLYSAIITKVSNALNTLVSGEKPARFSGPV